MKQVHSEIDDSVHTHLDVADILVAKCHVSSLIVQAESRKTVDVCYQ